MTLPIKTAVPGTTGFGFDANGNLTINNNVQITELGTAGAKNGSTVTAVEYGDDTHKKVVLTLTATPLTLADDAGVGQYGGVKLYDMAAGNYLFLGAAIDANITLVEAAWIDTAAGDVGLGTTAVTDGNALATTEQNIIPTTAIAAMVAQTGPIDALSTAATSGVILGTTAAPADVILNVRIDDDVAHAAGTATITGTVTLIFSKIGVA